jgi:hypothetical protein
MNRARCHHVTLAANAMGKVDYCALCNVVTLHIGVVSLRFDPESAESAWALLAQGLASLRAEIDAEQKKSRLNPAS